MTLILQSRLIGWQADSCRLAEAAIFAPRRCLPESVIERIDRHRVLNMKRLLWKLEWNEEMSVGIPEIDDDHRQFISSISELNQAIAARMRPAEIHRRLQTIVDETKSHFEREERFFKEWQYPGAEDHARIHANILKSLQDILESFMPYGLEAEWIDAALVIKDLLISHILVEDMKYAHYLQTEK